VGQYQFKLPDVGEGTAEAEIVTWHVKPGDKVKEDQPLVDMMTDKATVELGSPVEGVVESINGKAGDKAAVGSVLITLQVSGEGNVAAGAAPAKAPAPQKAAPAPAPEPKPAPKVEPKPQPAPQAAAAREPVARSYTPPAPGAKPAASPAVRRRAEELGIKLQFVRPSGPQARITHADLDAYIQGEGAVSASGPMRAKRTGVHDIQVIGMRRKIAEQMQASKRNIPHFTYVEEVDVTALEDLRAHMNRDKSKPKLTVLPFLMQALVKGLVEFPQFNATFDDEAGIIHQHEGVHIGIATQTDKGLMVPVVRHAEARDIYDMALELVRIANAARDGKAKREELSGSTITITSLGPLAGIVHTPVINRPEVAIIGPNKIAERPVVRSGQVVIRKMMNISTSCDHRVIDGADAANFIQRLKGLLEQPATIFM
jgi:2-oxoisovalerate dehydrogenase E2 component (dihydrolipoyl transacylase)